METRRGFGALRAVFHQFDDGRDHAFWCLPDRYLAIDSARKAGVTSRVRVIVAAMVNHHDGATEAFPECVGGFDVITHVFVTRFGAPARAVDRIDNQQCGCVAVQLC